MKSIIVSVIATAGLMVAGGVLAIEMPAMAKKYNCVVCHSVEKKLVGPAWRDVSKAYNTIGATGSAVNRAAYKVRKRVSAVLEKNNVKTAEEWLIKKVSQGGSGNWGTMPMPANDPSGSEAADIRELVKFILDLEKE